MLTAAKLQVAAGENNRSLRPCFSHWLEHYTVQQQHSIKGVVEHGGFMGNEKSKDKPDMSIRLMAVSEKMTI